ncbi:MULTISPECIES: PAS domain-containing sensor histidine kinase [unclassified Clostridium]|uniref:sensor histidine kinase n=1 Tax=unclassified Clostridium TaxID=2614128 RepID=UPI00029851BD|nr:MULTISPECIES: PAS domain-containing sensor histidine kinase [unclassified Clostridium]EKQ54482.1 MAG: signal transduction histidine kinase [Clostridium sp. Maddingley MBC34-26]
MIFYDSFDVTNKQSHIVVRNEIATEISKEFASMTEYSEEELLNKNISEIFNILKIGPSINERNINSESEYFLFSKSLDARFINIKVNESIIEKVYIFSEKPNSHLDVRFPVVEALCSHNALGVAIFSVPDITLLKANQTYLNFLDNPFKNKENSIGKRIHEIIPGWIGSTSENIWKSVLSTQKPFYSDEYMFEFERGITYWEASLAPVFENGILKYCIEITTDVTEKVLNRKVMEEQSKIIKKQNEQLTMQANLLKQQKEKLEKINEALKNAMDMKDEFLSVISHEFRMPLNVINTAIQTLNLVYSDQMTEKVKKYMGTIRQNTNRQLRLVNNLLDITRANVGNIKINKKNIDVVFLTKAITESVYEFASKKGVRVKFVSKLSKKIIGLDDEKYERIILNLLSNAIKFTPEGKSITVSLRLLKGNINIEVKDYGIGIPPDKLDIIFERFGQVDSSLSRQAEGTGIGLSLVKKLVEALGGSINVKSKLGKGATFTIVLPDEKAIEEKNEKLMLDLMNDNRLIQTTNIEFSDIYL